jgi:hypothetical protein
MGQACCYAVRNNENQSQMMPKKKLEEDENDYFTIEKGKYRRWKEV